MSANDYLADRTTRHSVFIQRLASGHVRNLLPLLEGMSQDISRRILLAGDSVSARRLNILLSEIDGIIAAATESMGQQLDLDLQEFAQYEAGFRVRLLESAADAAWIIPSAQEVAASVTNSSMEIVSGKNVKRLTVSAMVSDFSKAQQTQIAQAIRAGFIEGKTGSEITREIQALNTGRTRAQAEALVRTATNHIASEANRVVQEANSDYITHDRWVSVLDSRTTLVCAGLSGDVIPVSQGPFPPIHFNCRSSRVSYLPPEIAKPNLDGAINTEQGKTGARTTYGGWLRKQPAAFQDEALGRKRAELFRNGGLSIDKFTDDRGRAYTLDELRILEPLAFE